MGRPPLQDTRAAAALYRDGLLPAGERHAPGVGAYLSPGRPASGQDTAAAVPAWVEGATGFPVLPNTDAPACPIDGPPDTG